METKKSVGPLCNFHREFTENNLAGGRVNSWEITDVRESLKSNSYTVFRVCKFHLSENKREMTSIDQWRHVVFFQKKKSMLYLEQVFYDHFISVALVPLVYCLFPEIIVRFSP